MGGEEPEQRAQRVLHDEGVTQAAPGCGHHNGLSGEFRRVHEIEDVLEQAGIAALVNRRADDEGVRLLDGVDQPEAGRVRSSRLVAPRPGPASSRS